jgi:hypothetical protein
MTTEKFLIGVFVSVESAHAFSAFNPSLFTINRFRDQQTVGDITRGCIYASIFSLSIGLVSSLLIESWYPLIMSAAVSVGMSVVYLQEANKEVKT